MIDRPQYCSYLLRLWQPGDDELSEWRISLEDVRTRDRRGFADLVSLAAFLEAQMHGAPPDLPALKPQAE